MAVVINNYNDGEESSSDDVNEGEDNSEKYKDNKLTG